MKHFLNVTTSVETLSKNTNSGIVKARFVLPKLRSLTKKADCKTNNVFLKHVLLMTVTL